MVCHICERIKGKFDVPVPEGHGEEGGCQEWSGLPSKDIQTNHHQTTSATAATTQQEPPALHACAPHLFRFVVNFRRQQLVTLQLSSENSEELE